MKPEISFCLLHVRFSPYLEPDEYIIQTNLLP
jgi:hypothetical protein